MTDKGEEKLNVTSASPPPQMKIQNLITFTFL